jgi:hypothetical protein
MPASKPRKGAKAVVTAKTGVPGLPLGADLKCLRHDDEHVWAQYELPIPALDEEGNQTTRTATRIVLLSHQQWNASKRGSK